MNIIQEIEREQMDAVLKTRTVPEFSAGDTVKVMVKVIETDGKGGQSVRLQAYEGVVIARSGGGIIFLRQALHQRAELHDVPPIARAVKRWHRARCR